MLFVGRTLVATRVLEEIFLVVVFGVIPLPSRKNLRHNLLALRVKVLLLHIRGDLLGNVFLLRCEIEDGRAVFLTKISLSLGSVCKR